MRLIGSNEIEYVNGGAQAPSCTVVTATITGSNGTSSTQVAVICVCPEGTTMSSSSQGKTTTATCD